MRVWTLLDAAPAGPLALGFSGGGDSMALLLLAADWARARGRTLLPFIVDHRLQPGSAETAARAAARARAEGMAARVLVWDGEKPRTGVQSAARAARLRLLLGACREAGAGALLLAHTLDDQAETVWRRLASGGGWRGLAAMRLQSPAPVWPEGRGVILLRPLLETPRADLRAFLRAHGAVWEEDPANRDPRHARVRDRGLLARLDPAMTGRLAGIARHAGAAVAAEDRAAMSLIFRAVSAPLDGTLRLDPAALHHAGNIRPGALRLFQAALAAAAGAPHPPAPEAAARALARLRQGSAATLGGAAASVLRDGTIRLARDPGALLGRADRRGPGGPAAGPLMLEEGVETVWDGRFLVIAHAPDLGVRPLGRAWPRLPDDLRAALTGVPPAVRPGLPLLLRDGIPAGSLFCEAATVLPLTLERLQRLLFAGGAWFDAPESGKMTGGGWREGVSGPT